MATEYRILECERRTYHGTDDKGKPTVDKRVTVLYKTRDTAIVGQDRWKSAPRLDVSTAIAESDAFESKMDAALTSSYGSGKYSMLSCRCEILYDDKDAEIKRLCICQRDVASKLPGHEYGEDTHTGMSAEGDALVAKCEDAVKTKLKL